MDTSNRLSIELDYQVRSMTRSAQDRAERVKKVRRQIAAGSYESDDKLDVAVGRLMQELNLHNQSVVRLGKATRRRSAACTALAG